MASHGERPEPPKLVRKLRERRETHRTRGRIYRAAFAVGGVIVLLAGLAMLVTPGPAFVIIPIGLAILSLEFVWAERMLDRALEQGEIAKRKAAEATRAQKILSAVATACAIGAAITAAILWDIPFVPV